MNDEKVGNRKRHKQKQPHQPRKGHTQKSPSTYIEFQIHKAMQNLLCQYASLVACYVVTKFELLDDRKRPLLASSKRRWSKLLRQSYLYSTCGRM